ncbi:MAG: HPP family protein [Pseudomonadota bacterium]
MQSFFKRRLPKPTARAVVLAGVGGALAIAVLLALGDALNVALVIAPFGASCVLLFAVPAAPLSQPANVVGGHVVAAFAGLIVLWLLPGFWWSPALAVGLAISAMALLRVTHPPAGANPIVIFLLEPGWVFLLVPVLSGTICLVAFAMLYHRLNATVYPNVEE